MMLNESNHHFGWVNHGKSSSTPHGNHMFMTFRSRAIDFRVRRGAESHPRRRPTNAHRSPGQDGTIGNHSIAQGGDPPWGIVDVVYSMGISGS